MPRRWRGVLTLENTQTGDGRVMAPGSIEWADLPLPLNWMSEGGSMHIGLTTAAPQIGIIEAISREGDLIPGEGVIDDGTDEGMEICRRMDEGTAPLGDRFPVSIDPDNWEVEIIATDAGDDGEPAVILAAQGRGALSATSLRAVIRAALLSAAGDPDPGEDGGADGVVLFEDTVDTIIERYTRLRIRGATLCDIAAFDGASIELVSEAAAAEPVAGSAGNGSGAVVCEQVPEHVTFSSNGTVVANLPAPARPPAEWFTMAYPQAGDERLVQQIDGSWAIPLTITDYGQVFGHLARRDQGHRGYSRHTPPPTSRTGYAEFHVGHVVCADGTDVPTGSLVVAADHAPLSMRSSEARDFYANSGLGWADVRCYDGEFGPFVCGALRPSVTDDDLRVLRALSLSGDWRASGGNLELVAALAVNVPGFPIARESLAASAYTAIAAALDAPAVQVDGDEVVSLVAAGIVSRCSECAERAAERDNVERVLAAMDEATRLLRRIEMRTRYLSEADSPAVEAMQRRLFARNVAVLAEEHAKGEAGFKPFALRKASPAPS